MRPELLYDGAKFVAGHEVLVDDKGDVVEVRTARASEVRPEANGSAAVVELAGKAMLPGFVNAHSHAFQRLIRGKAETRAVSGSDFWSWRGTMYHAASKLDPQQVYDVSRMAFLEMLLAGTTTVGEFHYLHNAADGKPYEDPNVLARQVIAAARSVGIRIVLLRTAYLRSGFELAADPGQRRFFETAETFLSNMSALRRDCPDAEVGVAPHSLRAVPLGELHAIAAWAREHGLPVHMHVAEQLGENEACVREYGLTPVALLAREKLLGADFAAVHATHISDDEVALLAASGTTICACPTTERNLGDGIFRADAALAAGIPVALGSDSQAQIDPLEDARQLEYHLRLRDQKRALLDLGGRQSAAARLFDCATVHGARALGRAGSNAADFFTVDLDDVSVAGAGGNDLLPMVVFGLQRSAIRDVWVGGQRVVTDGRHALQQEIVARYREVHRAVWG